MPNGYATREEALLACGSDQVNGEWSWTPLQCTGCGEWFPVAKQAVDMLDLVPGRSEVRMTCEPCRRETELAERE